MRRDQGDLLAALVTRLQDAMSDARAAVDRSELVTAAARLMRDPAAMAKRCAWCGRLELAGGWRAPQRAPRFLVSTLESRATHTICPDCVRRLEESGQSRRMDEVSAHCKQPRDAEPEDGQGEP